MRWLSHNVTKRHAHIGELLELITPQEISEKFLDEVVLRNTLMQDNLPAVEWLIGNFYGLDVEPLNFRVFRMPPLDFNIV